MTDIAGIADRLARLEAADAIRALKLRYLRACDDKDPEAMRACFVPDHAHIHYDRIGSFPGRDALVQCFAELACRPTLREMHFAGQADIRVLDGESAQGSWDLAYLALDDANGSRTFLTGRYADEYVRVNGAWLIRSTVFRTGLLSEGT
ncbi:nuclear transport factor 2 family protein [Cupriavidus consociatus]|uniref:nuclear transport factor 2 family protein n=1 Tax=Cupriavidus consociatus TaxID=2821357 RepID=UPI001AE7A98F|nr:MULTISPECIES: nuclear transport factor 2 family protein [unclassified Cupriavidus]MBP0621554.1 nuclear transport factor 2 family protein [Cupriavidus sp. LEh25]MDK2658227.1 nuclear transport factor 2 family protein [Cupriavidus sp. LEh21]